MVLMTPLWSSSVFHAATPWQSSSGSLTARLRACGRFRVRVLHAGLMPATVDEALALRLPRRTLVYARTVCLEVDGAARVVARSVVSRSAMRRGWPRLRRQGSRPLAEMLWCNPRVERGQLHFAMLQGRHALHAALRAQWPDLPARAPARRACFYLHDQAMLVMEVFLPAIEELPCR